MQFLLFHSWKWSGTVVLDLAELRGSGTRSIQCLKAAHYSTLQPTPERFTQWRLTMRGMLHHHWGFKCCAMFNYSAKIWSQGGAIILIQVGIECPKNWLDFMLTNTWCTAHTIGQLHTSADHLVSTFHSYRHISLYTFNFCDFTGHWLSTAPWQQEKTTDK